MNFSIGQGDTIVTPLQLARAYAAISNGGTLWAPTVAKALVSPDGTVLRRMAPRKVAQLDVPKKYLDYIDSALQNVTRVGTMAWKMVGFPLDEVTVRAKTGSAEVYGKQTTGWVASYTEGLRRGDDDQPGRHRLGLHRRRHPGDLGGALRHRRRDRTTRARGDPRHRPGAQRLPQFLDDGSIMPPGVGE